MSPEPVGVAGKGPTITVVAATAAELHARDPFAVLEATLSPDERWVVCDLARPAIILGSRQNESVVDHAAASRAGFDVVRRRSGGGAVVLVPGDHVWIDTISEPTVFGHDVRASMVAVGERWAAALNRLAGPFGGRNNLRTDLLVHDGALVSTMYSDAVCFAGVGPGEVLVDGRKLVGLSQRRTRQGSWIQATVYRSAQPHDVGSMFHPPLDWSDLPPIATLADIGLADVTAVGLAAALAAT